MQKPLPQTRDLVLVGGGHTHALVLRKWGMSPLAGARVTVINPGPTAPYSGMLPGFVAGHYDRDALDIDLVQLARFAGARVIVGPATGLDTQAREIHVPGRPPVPYDVCSVNVGITSDMPALPGFAQHAIPAKPLGPFAARWSAYLAGDGPASVAVIGGGVAGAELILAMAHALRAAGRPAQLALIDRSEALTAVGEKATAILHKAMQDLGVTLIEQARITDITADHVLLEDGRQIPAGFVTGAAGARAYGWLESSGLDLHDGFITVDENLQSSDPSVFAAGDCAHLAFDPRPKAGVYAVREAPVLYDNLCTTLAGMPLRKYKPQKDYLKLISLGGKAALAEKNGLTLSGSLMWRWKDRIDRSFMAQFQKLPDMEMPDLPPVRAQGLDDLFGDKPMCGGCGAKVGRGALHAALDGVGTTRDDVTALPGDDAALLHTGGARQVLSTDHLRAFTDDPYLMARIAAVHALGDIWAMGAQPQAATANLILPRLSATLQERTLREITAAAGDVMRAAGADIVGGHSSLGDELTIGFSVTGLCDRDPVTLKGAQVGDALILTKPIGSGVIMAAEMQRKARGEWVVAALDHMAQAQGAASSILADVAQAMTDVTGFGLAGHLLGICEASKVGAALDLDAIPVMEGAMDLSDQGIRSSLFPDNHAAVAPLPDTGKAALLCDPQTAGGLLAAIPAGTADAVLADLEQVGYPAACIGTITEGTARISLA